MQNTQHITLTVNGMTCGSCVRHINAAIRALAGVVDVEVDLRGQNVSVDFDPARATLDQISAAIQVVGYQVAGLAP